MEDRENIYRGFAEGYQEAMQSLSLDQQSQGLALRFERLCPYDYENGKKKYHNLRKDAKESGENKPKFNWIKQFDGENAGNKDQLKQAHERRDRLCEAIGGRMFELKLDWRFLTGSGNPHPIENGLTWHPSLGVPYLPASGFKGLLRAFVEHWQGEEAKVGLAAFGDTDAAGELQFFDLLPKEPVKLLVDVMTPHYANWYVGGADNRNLDAEKIPAPWHNPVPIPFLVAEAKLTLRGMVALRPQLGFGLKEDDWIKLQNLIREAFSIAGAGAKTATGYGRMTLPSDEELAENERQRQEQKKKEQEEQEKIAKQKFEEEEKKRKEQQRLDDKLARQNMPPEQRRTELLVIVLGKGDSKAIAGYLCGKNFERDLEEWKLASDDMKAAFHENARMLAFIKQWSNGKGKEKEAYDKFKPSKKA